MNADIVKDIELDLSKKSPPVVVNAENGSNVTVNVNVKHYGYPEWLDDEVRKHFQWVEK
jgi:hypothetical protein